MNGFRFTAGWSATFKAGLGVSFCLASLLPWVKSPGMALLFAIVFATTVLFFGRHLAVEGIYMVCIGFGVAFPFGVDVWRSVTLDLHDIVLGVLALGLYQRYGLRRLVTVVFSRPLAIPTFIGFLAFVALPLGIARLLPEQARDVLFWFEHGNAARVLFGVCIVVAGARLTVRSQVQLMSFIGLLVAAMTWGSLLLAVSSSTSILRDFYIVVGLPGALMVTTVSDSILQKRAYAIMALWHGMSFLTAYSRSAMLAVLCCLVVMAIFGRRLRLLCVPVGLVMAVMVWPIVADTLHSLTLDRTRVIPDNLQVRVDNAPASTSNSPVVMDKSPVATETRERLESLVIPSKVSYTVPTRVRIWKDALRMGLSNTLLGVGYGNYAFFSEVSEPLKEQNPYFEVQTLRSTTIKQAHNLPLMIFAEVGLVGVGLLLWMWVTVLNGALRMLRDGNGTQGTYGFLFVFLIGQFSAILVMNLTGEYLLPRMGSWMGLAIAWWVLLDTGSRLPLVAARVVDEVPASGRTGAMA